MGRHDARQLLALSDEDLLQRFDHFYVPGRRARYLRRNLIVVLMSIELMLNAVNLAFVGFNRLHPTTLDGQVFVLMVIVVAASEVAVGLGIVISMFRNRDSVNIDEVSLLRW